MLEPENEFDETQYSTIPNAIIYKFSDDTLHSIKFVAKGDNVAIDMCELSNNDYANDPTLGSLELNQICLCRITFDFDLDDEGGLMELKLHKTIDLELDDEEITVEYLVKNDLNSLIKVYIEHIRIFY